MDPLIIIPAFNEEKAIADVIKDLKSHDYHNILVIDDGSKDRTAEIAKENGAKVIKHIINRGQGAALQTGHEYALKNGAETIVHFDADGQFIAKDIESMLSAINNGYEIVLGSRFLDKKPINIPLEKKIILKAGRLFTKIFSNISLSDTHNGFRAIKREALTKIKITQDGMAHASEIIDLIKKNNLKYKEVPVTVIYSEYALSKGQSIFNSLRIAFKLLIRKLTK
ncbi:MAG: glycosyltransferase family 2 protein [Candidatus Woesearchaeota archaeon]